MLRLLIYALLLLNLNCQANQNPNTKSNNPTKKTNKKNNSNRDKTVFVTPTHEVTIQEWPRIEDDIEFEGIELAIERQIRRFNQKDLNHQSIKLGNRVFPADKALESLVVFRSVVAQYKKCLGTNSLKSTCQNKLNQNLKTKFRLYAPKLELGDFGYEEENYARFTAYYTPLIKAATRPSKIFQHAIYSLPPTEEYRTLTRSQIDFEGGLKGKNLELFFTTDLFELYLLHVQGGGKISLQDRNEEYYISYAGTNSQKWRFISLYMREQGYINDLTIGSQKEFLLNNPDLQKEIYESCPSYVYFKVSNTPPEGSDLVPLTDGRSIATDKNFYSFKGLLSFVMAKRPSSNSGKDMQDFSRFFLDQDTGGAIKGKARVDLYHGEGEYAENAANHTDVRGQLYFLMLK